MARIVSAKIKEDTLWLGFIGMQVHQVIFGGNFAYGMSPYKNKVYSSYFSSHFVQTFMNDLYIAEDQRNKNLFAYSKAVLVHLKEHTSLFWP